MFLRHMSQDNVRTKVLYCKHPKEQEVRTIEESITSAPASGAGGSQEQEIEQALVRSAVGYTQRVQKSYKVRRIEYNDDGKKSCEFDEIVQGYDEKYVPPSVAAQQFWLKNRASDRWGRGTEIEESGVVELPAVLEAEDGEEEA